MQHSAKLSGVFAPIVTVFDEQENILLAHIVENILAYNQTQLRGYMPLGSNGEFQGLTDREALNVLEAVCCAKAADKIIVGGCGRESARKTVEFIQQVANCGLDYAFVLPPHYFLSKMSEEALYRFYMQVADGSPIPIIIYNAPKFAAGIQLSPALIQRLSSHPNIVAMKNSSTTPNRLYIEAVDPDEFLIIAGNVATFYPGLCDGACGGVLSTASYLPEYCCRLYGLYRDGHVEQAKVLHEFLCTLSAATIGPMGVAGVKLGLELRGLHGGHVRVPLLDATSEEREQVDAYFRQVGRGPFHG